MLRIFIGVTLFLFWATWARNYYVCEVLQACNPPVLNSDSSLLASIPKTLSILKGQKPLLQNEIEFHFDYASHAPNYFSEHTLLLKKIVQLLHKHPQSRLKITGIQTKEEAENIKPTRRYSNLGIARAQVLADKLNTEFKTPLNRIIIDSKITTQTVLHRPIKFTFVPS
jgi:hypothetical protein